MRRQRYKLTSALILPSSEQRNVPLWLFSTSPTHNITVIEVRIIRSSVMGWSSSSSSPPSPGDQQQQQQPLNQNDYMHKTKMIHFLERTTPIVLQNDNGPCPLLAICTCVSPPLSSPKRQYVYLNLSTLMMRAYFQRIVLFVCVVYWPPPLDRVWDPDQYNSLNTRIFIHAFNH